MNYIYWNYLWITMRKFYCSMLAPVWFKTTIYHFQPTFLKPYLTYLTILGSGRYSAKYKTTKIILVKSKSMFQTIFDEDFVMIRWREWTGQDRGSWELIGHSTWRELGRDCGRTSSRKGVLERNRFGDSISSYALPDLTLCDLQGSVCSWSSPGIDDFQITRHLSDFNLRQFPIIKKCFWLFKIDK